jgi:AraC-like DNA-binding protein
MVSRAPHPALLPHVRQYAGWFEHMAVPFCRRELPTEEVPVIISFGAPIRVYDAGDLQSYRDLGSFATGAYDSYIRVLSSGPMGGIQINFTILGARLFLDRPLAALTNCSVPLEDILGPMARRLEMELYDAPTWDARFDILDRVLTARLMAATPPSREVVWAWCRMVQTGGRIGIGRIVDEVGWSQKHLIARFREDIGLSPKIMARVLRFSNAARVLRGPTPPRLTDIALDCGYYDQAHFTRDFRAFAGVTPTELVSSLLPDGGGISADR